MEKLSQKELDRLYPLVGEIIVQWGLIDVMLQHLAFSMFKVKRTTPAREGWPLGFGHRLSILEDRFKKWPEFKGLSNEAKPLLKAVRHHLTLRDMLAHGAAGRYDPTKDGVIFRRIDPTTNKQKRRRPHETHRHARMFVRFSTLSVVAGNCVWIAGALLDLHARIRSIEGPDWALCHQLRGSLYCA